MVFLRPAGHPCCGSLGRHELLLSAGEKLGRQDWVAEARAIGLKLVDRSKTRRGWRFDSFLPPGLFNPGFFNGASGVAYQLSRLAYPSDLPDVLLFE